MSVLFDSNINPKMSNWLCCYHRGMKRSIFQSLDRKIRAGFKIGYFCYSKFISGDPKNGTMCQDTEFTHWSIYGQTGGVTWSWGAGDIGTKPPVGTDPQGQSIPYPGAAQPLWGSSAHWSMTVSELGRDKNFPMELIQSDGATLTLQKMLSIVYVLSVVFYLTVGYGKTVLGFPTLDIDSVQQGGIFTLKLIWNNSCPISWKTPFPDFCHFYSISFKGDVQSYWHHWL